jgi:hypothetical protein
LEEVAVHAGHKVFMKVDDNNALIVDDQQGISGQQLRPHPTHFLNIIIIISVTYLIIKVYIFKWYN